MASNTVTTKSLPNIPIGAFCVHPDGTYAYFMKRPILRVNLTTGQKMDMKTSSWPSMFYGGGAHCAVMRSSKLFIYSLYHDHTDTKKFYIVSWSVNDDKIFVIDEHYTGVDRTDQYKWSFQQLVKGRILFVSYYDTGSKTVFDAAQIEIDECGRIKSTLVARKRQLDSGWISPFYHSGNLYWLPKNRDYMLSKLLKVSFNSESNPEINVRNDIINYPNFDNILTQAEVIGDYIFYYAYQKERNYGMLLKLDFKEKCWKEVAVKMNDHKIIGDCRLSYSEKGFLYLNGICGYGVCRVETYFGIHFYVILIKNELMKQQAESSKTASSIAENVQLVQQERQKQQEQPKQRQLQEQQKSQRQAAQQQQQQEEAQKRMLQVLEQKHLELEHKKQQELQEKQRLEMERKKQQELQERARLEEERRKQQEQLKRQQELKEKQRLEQEQRKQQQLQYGSSADRNQLTKEEFAPIQEKYTPQHFLSQTPKTFAGTDSPIPEWKRMMIAKKLAAAAAKEEEERISQTSKSSAEAATNDFGHKLRLDSFGKIEQNVMHQARTANAKVAKSKEIAEKETETLKSLEHPRIIEYYGCKIEQNSVTIFMEYMPAGSLGEIIKKEGPIGARKAVQYIEQILDGLTYVHQKGIVHADLKCDNLLLDGVGNLKLADFGIAVELRLNEANNSSLLFSAAGGGTLFWMAPEILCGEKFGRRADIWSLGCTIVEMLAGKPPYDNVSQMKFITEHAKKSLSYDPEKLAPTASPAMKRLLSKFLQTEQDQRPHTASEAADLFKKHFS